MTGASRGRAVRFALAAIVAFALAAVCSAQERLPGIEPPGPAGELIWEDYPDRPGGEPTAADDQSPSEGAEEEGEEWGEDEEAPVSSPGSGTSSPGSSAAALPAAAMAGFMSIFLIFYFMFIMLTVLIGVGGAVLSALAVYDCARRDFDDPNTRAMWCLLIALTRLIGAIIYYFVVYKPNEPPIQQKRPSVSQAVGPHLSTEDTHDRPERSS